MRNQYIWTDLTAFQQECLFAIDRADPPAPHGLRIKAMLEERSGVEVRHGRLYPNLDRLVDERLVEKGKKDDRTNECGTTARKQRALRANPERYKGAVRGASADA